MIKINSFFIVCFYCNKGIYLLLLEGDMYSLISLKRYLRKLHISFTLGGDIMYNNPYYSYNPQANIDRINNQIAELEKMKQQIPQQLQPNINQTFQLAPSGGTVKYANTIDDVSKEYVTGETPFFTKDFSQMWLKNTRGDIKTYTLTEIVSKDEKDILINSLQFQIEELRKEIKDYAKSNNEYANESNQNQEPTNVSNARTGKKKQ